AGGGNDALDFTAAALIGITGINGGAGNDTLTGSAGADKLIGGGGSDTMKGGGGGDLFVYAIGTDKVQDFLQGSDHIDVSATGVSDFAALQSLGRQVGANTVFTFSTGNTLTLVGAQFNKLTAGDFGLSNTPPTFTSGPTASESENSDPSHVVYQATVNDPDGGPAVFSLEKGGDNDLLSINSSTGEITFKNSPDFENPQDVGGDNTYNIVIHANDGTNDVTKSVATSVTDVNDNSSVTGFDLVLTNVADETDFIIPEWALLANDSDKVANKSLQVSAVSNAVGGTLGGFTPTSGTNDPVTYQTTGSGAHSFHYAASDGVDTNDHLVTITRVPGATIQGGDADEILIGATAADTLRGGGGSNVINGGAGNDELSGDRGAAASHSGDNRIDGGVGDDRIYGGLGGDTLAGGDGNDSIFGYSDYFGNNPSDGNDMINGGAGDDVVLGGSGNDQLTGADGNDTFHGDDGNDSLDGGDGNDSLLGDAGDDGLDGGTGDNVLYGAAGNDTITAGSGNDTISADDNDGDTGVDHVTAGGGDDTVTFYHTDVGDSADGGTGFDRLFLILTATSDVFDVAAQTSFINFEQSSVAGGGGDDMLTGAGGDDKFYGDTGPGIDGNDTVNGRGGNDNISGGGGNNTINGGDGDDFIEGDSFSQTPGVGNNAIDGGNGNDYIAGGLGSDTLTGGDGNDGIYGYSAFYFGDNGADGKDNIDGGKGNDFITGGSGDDTIAGGIGSDNLQGDDGNDTIAADTSSSDTDADFVQGGHGDDTVTFNHYDVGDSADGGTGFDKLFLTLTEADENFDVASQTMFISFEDCTVFGGGGDDVLTGSDNHEKFYGDSGPGADGNDTLNGLGGDDNIDGGGGNNTIDGGDGNDFIEGDAFSATPGVGNNTIEGGNGDDFIAGGLGSDTLTGGDGNDGIYGYSAFYFGDNGADGKDNIDGGKGNDFVTAGSGDDTITGGTGTDNLQGDDGDDTITADTSGSETDTDFVQGGAGNDTVTFFHYDSGDIADGGSGSLDILNLFFGGEENKSGDVIGSGFANFERVNLHGGGGNDTLTGLGSTDQLFGDDGNDILTGAGGNDALTGGAGSDTFEYKGVSSGIDTITDFIHASDVIDLDAIDANTGKADDQDFAFVSAQNSGTVANNITWFQDTLNNQTVIQADNTGDTTADLTIVLQGKVDLTATDFHL
ncbi:MAG TPA: hypothetical protein VHL34_10195, partial [Rhizomicrobium sp.]|nr:hypothetical protein [Rhizomicrobium sp.]